MNTPGGTPEANASAHPNYKMFTFVSLVMPAAGMLLGFFLMMQDDQRDKALGAHALKVCVFGVLAWMVGYLVIPPLFGG